MQTSVGTALPRCEPESVGVSSAQILSFLDGVKSARIGLHSLMVLRHGRVVAEGWWKPYERDDVHIMHSLSKSFTSTAIGLAIEEGRLKLDDRVLSFFPEDAPANPSENQSAMRIRHLLSMSTGHAEDSTPHAVSQPEGNWAKGFLELEVPFVPGTHFVYNSGATYMLSAILQKLTGVTTFDYLKPRLFEKLGIERANWDVCPRGINTGGWGLSVTTESIAKFGQLYLQNGQWQGEQIVPASWVEQASAKHISNGTEPDNDWNQGYGFQFWRSRHNCYRGDGAFGQYCVISPDSDMVIAITASVSDMQAVLNLLWQHLLTTSDAALPGDAGANTVLQDRLSELSLPLPVGTGHAPTSDLLFESTQAGSRLRSVRFEFDAGTCRFTISGAEHGHCLRASDSEWIVQTSGLLADKRQTLAIAGVWTSADTYVMKIHNLERTEITTIASCFTGDDVSVKFSQENSIHAFAAKDFAGKLANQASSL